MKKIILITLLPLSLLMAGSFVMSKGKPLIKAEETTSINPSEEIPSEEIPNEETSIDYEKTITVNSIEELENAVSSAHISTKIILKNGIYTSKDAVLSNNSAPVYIVAENHNSVIFQRLIIIDTNNITIDGFLFNGGSINSSTGGEINNRGDNNRITYCTWDDSKARRWCRSTLGHRFELDHCTFKNKTNNSSFSQAPTIAIYSFQDDSIPTEHHIHHNYFYNITKGQDSNGYESIIVYSQKSQTDDSTPPIAKGIDHNIIIEYNLFEKANGEGEIISGKTSGTIYQYNTFKDCEGGITLRYGRNCIVRNNIIYGNNNNKAYGIRVMDANQQIYNNYITDIGTSMPGIEVYNGGNSIGPALNFNIHDNYVQNGQYNIRFGRITDEQTISATGILKDNTFVQGNASQVINLGILELNNITSINNHYFGTLGNTVSGFIPLHEMPMAPSFSIDPLSYSDIELKI